MANRNSVPSLVFRGIALPQPLLRQLKDLSIVNHVRFRPVGDQFAREPLVVYGLVFRFSRTAVYQKNNRYGAHNYGGKQRRVFHVRLKLIK